MLAKILNWVGNIWLILAGLMIATVYVWTGVNQGWSKVWDWLSPFNVLNALAVLLTLAPGLVAKAVASKLYRRGKRLQ